jgi:rare lipoprotein A
MFCFAAWLCALAPSHAEVCRASWYGYESELFTASGERFNPHGLTAASWKHPFGTRLLVTYAGRSVVVRINDRGPARGTGRCLDLSEGAARSIRLPGVATVSIHRLN